MQKDIYNLDIVISDTSSLSNLTNIRRLDLLKSLYNNIIITKEVSDEYKKEYKEKLPNWIIVKEVKNKENIIDLRKKTKYGLGEISSIVYALENPNTLIIIDDQKPKMFALDLGLHVIGSIGVIRQAVDKNVIKSKEEANMLFDEIKNTGGWISDKFLKNIK
jgi:predicted nucleic acid-binding protein